MKRILIAIDYHPVSEKVAEAGYKLAKQLDAKVCLLHVMANEVTTELIILLLWDILVMMKWPLI
jgi:nucleotide-binding universal stress UspA family protein